MKERIQTLVSDKKLADKLMDTVIKSYEQIKIAKKDLEYIKNFEVVSDNGQKPNPEESDKNKNKN